MNSPNSDEASAVFCPVCEWQSKKNYSVDSKKVSRGLQAIFKVSIPDSILKINYDMYECTNCELNFAWPLVPGNSDFYNFITSKDGYYTDFRPEYKIIWDILESKKNEIKILDVGCGDGGFLGKANKMPHVKAIGIDTTIESVNKAKKNGIEAYQIAIENFDQNNFDAIMSFHCLEHVNNPIGFISEMVKRIKPDGSLYISTPYSPVSYEYFWFHPLNHPPHHILRLNKKSYEEIAKKLNLKIRFHNFEKMSFKSHVRSCFSYAQFGFQKKNNIYFNMLFSPFLSLKVIAKILKRDKFDGVVAGNDILVELYK